MTTTEVRTSYGFNRTTSEESAKRSLISRVSSLLTIRNKYYYKFLMDLGKLLGEYEEMNRA
jgi:hypothetical protein